MLPHPVWSQYIHSMNLIVVIIMSPNERTLLISTTLSYTMTNE